MSGHLRERVLRTCLVLVALSLVGCGEGAIGEPSPRDYDPQVCIPECAGKECGSDGCGGSCGTCSGADSCNNISGLCVAPVGLIWKDAIQSGSEPYGFHEFLAEYPQNQPVPPSDANGCNLSRVPDPLGGGGYALRQYGVLDEAGARSELGLWSFLDDEFGDLALSGAPVYVAQEWYFPETIEAGGNTASFLSLLDWHSVGGNGGNRWHTCPGMMLNEDGSMRFHFAWGCDAWQYNDSETPWSNIAMPVGEWFDIEMRWQFATEPTGTVSMWINGELALEQVGVVTASPGHSVVEFYIKLYGSSPSYPRWSPSGATKYVRNVRISGERIWR